MAKEQVFMSRRALLVGSSALGGLALLTACGGGGGGSNAASASALGVGDDISQLIDINPKDVSELQQGGELKLSATQLGPDFNVGTQTGYTISNVAAVAPLSPISVVGLWQSDYEGNYTVNPDFCESFEAELVDGVQVLHIKLNPNAKYNDGTPIDIEALRATTEILRDGQERGFNIVDAGPHAYIESLEEEGDSFSVRVTMSRPYYPIEDIFGAGILHPAVNDAEVFNNGFIDNFHSEWQAGPFKLESWDSSEKVATYVRNDSWWGEKPVLDRVILRQMEASASRAAFKNGEIDAAGANTLTSYRELEGTAGSEVRRGQRLFAGGINMSSLRLPVELRKAIFAAIDRQALADISFNGLNWTEKLPGSMILMPFSDHYEDNFSRVTEGWDASTILEDAGYSRSGDYYQKDGARAKFAVTTFGDDPVTAAMAQTLVQQMKDAGIECTIDNQPDANFGTVVGNRDFDMTFSGYSVGSDATVSVRQFYHSDNNNGVGTEEIDVMIEELGRVEDAVERNRLCNEVERKHMEEFAMMGTVFNGPEIYVAKTGLANYGAALFGSLRNNPQVWSRVGWVSQ